MSATNPTTNLPLWTAVGATTFSIAPAGKYVVTARPSQLAGGNEQAASGLPVAAITALQAALWQTRGTEFSADNLWRNLSPAMREVIGTHPNALGWILSRASKLKQVKRTGRTIPSIRPNARGRQVAVWVWLA